MRKIAIVVVLLGVTLIPSLRAAAAARICGNSENAGYIDCDEVVSGGANGGVTPTSGQSNSTSGGSGSRSPSIKYVPYDRLVIQPDGQGCVMVGYVAEGVQPTDAAPPDPSRTDPVEAHGNIYRDYPPCPERPTEPGQLGQPAIPAAVLTEAMVAARYWERVHLPVPTPAIAPGRAITGKLAYLETKGQVQHTYTNSTTFGPLEIQAKGLYTVAWGDGVVTGPYALEGTPWPSGQITHEYLSVGAYDVVVTERWTATWRLNGKSGELRTLQTSGRIDDFAVEQIQAVIAR